MKRWVPLVTVALLLTSGLAIWLSLHPAAEPDPHAKAPASNLVSADAEQVPTPVRHITESSIAGAPAWALADDPEWQVSDEVVSGIAGLGLPEVALLRSGRLAILSPYDATIVILDPRGAVERVVGGYGEGPSQFGSIFGIAAVSDDSLVVVDVRNARLATIQVSTGDISTFPLPKGMWRGYGKVVGAIPGRGFLIHGFGRVRQVDPGKVTRPLAPWGVFGSDQSWTAWPEVPDAETAMIDTRYGGRPQHEPVEVVWGARTNVVVAGGAVFTVHGTAAEIVTRDADGRVTGQMRLEVPRRAVTRESRDAVIAQRLADLEMMSEPVYDIAESRRVITATPFADSLPAIERMLVAADGTIWVLGVIASGDSAWRAIGLRPDGGVVGTVVGPAAVTPVAFGNEVVIGVSEGSDGSRLLSRWAWVRR